MLISWRYLSHNRMCIGKVSKRVPDKIFFIAFREIEIYMKNNWEENDNHRTQIDCETTSRDKDY